MKQPDQPLITRSLTLVVLAVLGLLGDAFAASITLSPGDSNSRITVENAVIDGDTTTLFFLTWPYLGDANSGKPCPLNYYAVTLEPGLPEARARVVAEGVCGGQFQVGRLLDDGEAVIIVEDRIERWRDGERLGAKTFGSLAALEGLSVDTARMGAQFFEIFPDGGAAIARHGAGPLTDSLDGATALVTGLTPDGERRWIAGVGGADGRVSLQDLWAGAGGAALLRVTSSSTQGFIPVTLDQLIHIDGEGDKTVWPLTESDDQAAIEPIENPTPEDMQRLMRAQGEMDPEMIRRLAVQPRGRGGFDVLLERKGGGPEREGHFLFRLGADGTLQSEIALGEGISEHGLENWQAFRVEAGRLILFGNVSATQPGVQARRKTYPQGVVSWIDLDTGDVLNRLIPLDERYLEAAMNTGDEGIQHLPGLPGGEPVFLTRLGGNPLAVSLGFIGGRNVMRIAEATDDLVAWTEAHDRNQARIAREASRQQRKADREANRAQLNADLAASVGMTPEEFAALSSRERKEIMLRQGDLSEIQQIAVNQGRAAPGADQQSQMAEQLAQIQEQIANNPNMTPEMRAQMSAILAAAQQQPGLSGNPAAAGAGSSVTSAPDPVTAEDEAPEDAIQLDQNLRGFLEYESEDGGAMALLILDHRQGRELFRREYPDGSIYEFIDFSRFGVPLDDIGVEFRNARNEIVRQPALVVQH